MYFPGRPGVPVLWFHTAPIFYIRVSLGEHAEFEEKIKESRQLNFSLPLLSPTFQHALHVSH